MSENKEKPQAFPYSGVGDDLNYSKGMTLRDYFAAKAIAPVLVGAVLPEESWSTMLPFVSKFAYALADEMIKARKA